MYLELNVQIRTQTYKLFEYEFIQSLRLDSVFFLQEIRDAENKEVDCYEVTCRQMAYDAEMWDLVDLIDDYNGEAWTYGKKKDRQPRLKKPLELKIQVSSISLSLVCIL